MVEGAEVRKQQLTGVLALAVAIGLWASFALTIRGIGHSTLTPVDAAMIRFATPVVLLSPWIPQTLRALRTARPAVLGLLLVGGLPHFLLSTFGGELTSAALVGVLLPGTAPLFVAAILFFSWRERLPLVKTAALGLIVVGVVATAALTGSSATSIGVVVLTAGGLAWAVYTIGLRMTHLGAPGVALVVCAPSAVVAFVLAACGFLPSHLLTVSASLADVAGFTILQGVGTGIVSTLSFAYAVRSLGSAVASTAGALSPVLTTVLAVPLFGEPITAAIWIAVCSIVGGVLWFNLSRSSSRAPRTRRASTLSDTDVATLSGADR